MQGVTEVVGGTHLDTKCLSDLLRGLPSDKIGTSSTGDIQERWDVQEVCGEHETKERSLVHIHKLFVKMLDLHICGTLMIHGLPGSPLPQAGTQADQPVQPIC
jgi:hypothetical protein